eukprot:6710945-Pyramimonas_sp.AAC.1
MLGRARVMVSRWHSGAAEPATARRVGVLGVGGAGAGAASGGASGRDVQPALVIGRHYVTERDSAPVQCNGIV